MTTPTPGDLSARQVIADMQSVADLRTIRHSYIGEKLKGWIAALSALPAAGEPVAWRWWDDTHWSYGERPSVRYRSTPLYLTPSQPSAATPELLDIAQRARNLVMEICEDASFPIPQTFIDAADDAIAKAIPAIGAQGDGWQDKVLEILRPLLDTGDSRTADDKAVAIYAILADSAPAAGKGVGEHPDDEAAECPHCVYGIVPMTEGRPCPHCNGVINDAAVGAQGDGLRSALVRLLEAYDDSASEFEAAAAAQQARDALSAAPAAGKGVSVDPLRALACEVENHRPQGHPLYGKYHVSEQFVRAAAELAKTARAVAALTRQPVAGDGMVLVPREQLSSLADTLHDNRTTTDSGLPVTVFECIDVAQAAATEIRRLLAAAPAATPTTNKETPDG